VLLYEDEFSLSNTETLNYLWAERGNRPVVEVKQRGRERVTAFGSYNYATGQMTISFSKKGNSETLKKHLKKVLYTYKEHPKIIMVVDKVKYHTQNI